MHENVYLIFIKIEDNNYCHMISAVYHKLGSYINSNLSETKSQFEIKLVLCTIIFKRHKMIISGTRHNNQGPVVQN